LVCSWSTVENEDIVLFCEIPISVEIVRRTVVRNVLMEQRPGVPAILCAFTILDVYCLFIFVEIEHIPEIPDSKIK
jgi:hypothetical protein